MSVLGWTGDGGTGGGVYWGWGIGSGGTGGGGTWEWGYWGWGIGEGVLGGGSIAGWVAVRILGVHVDSVVYARMLYITV